MKVRVIHLEARCTGIIRSIDREKERAMNVQVHTMTETDNKLFENLVNCDPVMINHVVIAPGEGFDAHHTDSNVFINILRGRITLTFEDGSCEQYASGQLVEVPYRTYMKIDNSEDAPLELVVVKAPNPRTLA